MDTAKRLVMPKYYNDSREMMVAALAEIKSLYCDFLVRSSLYKRDAALHFRAIPLELHPAQK